MFCILGVLPLSGGCSPACGTCLCCVTCKSGQAVLIITTYGSASIGLRGLLFVLGGLFALDGGGASAHSGYPLALRALRTCASSDFLSSAVVTIRDILLCPVGEGAYN